MKLSELKALIENAIAQHGDLECFHPADGIARPLPLKKSMFGSAYVHGDQIVGKQSDVEDKKIFSINTDA